MQTKFNIGDSVLIKGTIREIKIVRGCIYYDVDTEGNSIDLYGFSHVREEDIEKWKEKENDSMH